MIELKEINQTNYQACIKLEISREQKEFVAPNWYSLLEDNYEKKRQPFALYHEEEIVGFIMFSYYPADADYAIDSWWIERLMIDKNYQGKGYGRAALKLALNWFSTTIGADELRLSVVPANDVALKLYHSLGFELTGEEVSGETVLLKQLKLVK